jgi:hypothetical protein
MSISVFPAPAAASEEAAFAATIPALQTTYENIQEFSLGIYAIDIVPTTTQASLTFVDDTSVVATLTTINGIGSVQLNSAATKVYITTLAGGSTDAVVTITKTASALTPDDIGNGTLDTINTTGTYNQTGLLSVLAFGGGAAGGRAGIGNDPSGAGGAAGGVVLGFVYNNGATTVTVGAKGTAAISNNTNITTPNASSFGNLLTSSTNNFFYAGAGGNSVGAEQNGNVGIASRAFASFNTTSTTGGGGSGNNRTNATGRLGAGSGIGTGGTGAPGGGDSFFTANPTTAGTAGTGKASGGGGGTTAGNDFPNAAGRFGGDGTDGVVYILRGF